MKFFFFWELPTYPWSEIATTSAAVALRTVFPVSERSNVHDRPIDYHALCLCFQAFTPDSCTGILQPLTAPVVSNVIHNASKKNTSTGWFLPILTANSLEKRSQHYTFIVFVLMTDCAPKIMKMSHYEASASCPQPVIMLTTHVPSNWNFFLL